MRKRRRRRPQPDRARTLTPMTRHCPECRQGLQADSHHFRTVTTREGTLRLTLSIRRGHNRECPRFLRPYRPEAEPHFALPSHEFGLDVLTTVGRLRSAEHRSIPEIHRELTRRGIPRAPRTVTNLLDRYDELRALATADPQRWEPLLRSQHRVVWALDGLPPEGGHEVRWVVRDCLSGEILLAQSLWSSTAQDLAGLITQVRKALPDPITGVVTDGQESLRKAGAQALPGVPHQLGQFHSLRAAAQPISEADRQAQKEWKERVRGLRKIERPAEQEEDDAEAEIVRGACAAVRAAGTDDGLPPPAASGLKWHDRLSPIAASLDRVAAWAGGLPGGLRRRQPWLRRGWEETAALGPPVRAADQWVKRVARVLQNEARLPAKPVRRRLRQLLVRMRQAAAPAPEPAVGANRRHFRKVTQSYRPGRFRCDDSADWPRTNDDLEHGFGSHRDHERRSSGRRRAAPGWVVMGSARLIADWATRLRPEEGLVLRHGDVPDRPELRAELEQRRESRRKQRRFRHDPAADLTGLNRCQSQ